MLEKIYIVIPSYNEGEVIATTVSCLVDLGYEVIVVDDGSSDDTSNILSSLPIYYLRHPVNMGQGAALQTGMIFALGIGAKILVHFDADGQHNADDIPKLITPIQADHADIVLGTRFIRSTDASKVPFLRKILLKGAIIVNGVLTGVWLTDAHNGFRALSRAAMEKIYLRQNGFAHATEIIDQIREKRLRVIEIPTTISYTDYSRIKGQSALNALDIFFDLITTKFFK